MSELLSIVSRSLRLLDPKLRRRWSLFLPWSIASASLEMAATAAMLVLIRLIGGTATDPLFRKVAAFFRSEPDVRFIALFALCLAGFFLFKNLLRVLETYAQQKWAGEATVSVASGLMSRYLHGPYSLHLQRNSAELLHALTDSASKVCWEILQTCTALVSEIFIVIGILSILVSQLPAAAFVAAGLAAAIMMALLWVTQNRHVVWGKRLHVSYVQLIRTVNESLAAVKEAKVLGRESYFVGRMVFFRWATARIEIGRHMLEILPRLVVETAFVLALALLILPAWLFPGTYTNLLSTLGIFAYGGLRLLPSLHLIVFRFNFIGGGKASIDAIDKDWHALSPEYPLSANLRPLTRDIVLDRVSFTYPGAESPAIRDISLAIARGESIGVVGHTGSGKSTLIDLILGLLPPSSGEIRVDGTGIHTALWAWHAQIGYVPQSIYLIDGTIRDNIALGIPPSEIDDAKVFDAARAAQLEAFLESLPQGLDTLTGERGVNLSGGERQRIAIARALYRQPSILIFDEATASLDNATERDLTATIHALHGRVTLILIAHRLTTVQDCDRLIVLRNGALVAEGSYDELLTANELAVS